MLRPSSIPLLAIVLAIIFINLVTRLAGLPGVLP